MSQESQDSLTTNESFSTPSVIEVPNEIKKKYLVKVHDSANNNSPSNTIQLLSIKDLFQVSQDRHNMNRFEYAKRAQTEYLNELKEMGGDIHFFKKTNFSYRYEREVIINSSIHLFKNLYLE